MFAFTRQYKLREIRGIARRPYTLLVNAFLFGWVLKLSTRRRFGRALPHVAKRSVFTDHRGAFNNFTHLTGTARRAKLDDWVKSRPPSTVKRIDGLDQWYKHTTVCVDGSDGVLYVEGKGTYEKSIQMLGFYPNASMMPLLPRPLDVDKYRSVPTYVLTGTTFLTHCWRGYRSPFHFILGYAPLFSRMIEGKAPRGVDNVILHQCPTPFDDGDFFTTFWRVSVEFGFSQGFFTPNTRFFSTDEFSPLFCMEEVQGNEYSRNDWFGLHRREFRTWQRYLEAYLYEHHKSSYRVRRHVEQRSQVRIAVFMRTEGINGRRKNENLGEVLDLVKTYDENYINLTVSKNDSLMTLVEKFNSFDILITPLGSHLGNLLFTFSQRTVVIELTSTCISRDGQRWLENRMKHIISSGHTPTDKVLRELAENCDRIRGDACEEVSGCESEQLTQIISADLHIKTDILTRNLEEAYMYLLS